MSAQTPEGCKCPARVRTLSGGVRIAEGIGLEVRGEGVLFDLKKLKALAEQRLRVQGGVVAWEWDIQVVKRG